MDSRVKKILRNPKLLFLTLGQKGFFNWMDDRRYIKIAYKIKTGHSLDLDNPQSFNEKIQWLKLNDRNPEHVLLVDKYEAKKIVAKRIGEEHVIPTLGVWSSYEDIDFSKLPDQFVLKCTHDSGGMIICRNKATMNHQKSKKKITRCLKQNYFYGQREWAYKDVKPRIICEKYMEDSTAKQMGSKGLTDYKFFCFNGIPKFVYVSCGLENHDTAQISFLTMDWNFANFKRNDYQGLKYLPEKPSCFDQMTEYATVLSQDEKFVRVDFYEINQQVYFGEITYYPCSGFMPFDPPEYDILVGKMLVL